MHASVQDVSAEDAASFQAFKMAQAARNAAAEQQGLAKAIALYMKDPNA
jgi:hypothetical protein